jgi:hypothetical protein
MWYSISEELSVRDKNDAKHLPEWFAVYYILGNIRISSFLVQPVRFCYKLTGELL